jgi:diguanylate cyclase (GGDEF)-like protein
MTALLAGDIGFLVAVFAGAADSYGRWIDAAYLLFYLLVGLALMHHDAGKLLDHEKPRGERLSPLRLVALGCGSLLAPLTLLAGSVADNELKVRGAAFGAAVLFLLVMQRMAQLIRTVETNSELLEVQARTDSLTGLPNRRTFDFELDRATRAEHVGHLASPVSVAMLDLDRFKAFNDSRGHAAGDALLRRAADDWSIVLQDAAPSATLARYGGEEFAVLLPGVDETTAATLVRELLPVTPHGQSFSAGVAEWNHDEEPFAALARADERLYQAKAGGRARVVGATAADVTTASDVSAPTAAEQPAR